MSPLVQRPRATAAPRPDPTAQHWSMLLFESLSAGVLAIFVGFVLVSAVVGVYVLIVWPLTFWDLANVAMDQYQSWAEIVLWSVFAGGSLAGYCCFSGLAFKSKSKTRVPVRSA